ncbi:MAG TPA: hypothetical protein VFT82_00225, partial [Candidatus Paceibacterota bacterium]|nr:hypothetical protein [Candidatus Paceibacterota bacterium]
LIVARVMDKHGDIEMPEGSMQKLWNLARAARATQENFSGLDMGEAGKFAQGGVTRAFQYRLKEGVLSIRALDRIIRAWQADGYKNELDFYVFKEFVNQPTKLSDKAYLYQQFKDQYALFQGEGWNKNPDFGTQGNVTKFDVRAPEIRAGKLEFIDARKTVDTVFSAGPAREDWPDYRRPASEKLASDPEKRVSPEIAQAERLQKLEEYRQVVERRVSKFKEQIAAIPTSDVDRTLSVLKKAEALNAALHDLREKISEAIDSGNIAPAEVVRAVLDTRIDELEKVLGRQAPMKLDDFVQKINDFYGPKGAPVKETVVRSSELLSEILGTGRKFGEYTTNFDVSGVMYGALSPEDIKAHGFTSFRGSSIEEVGRGVCKKGQSDAVADINFVKWMCSDLDRASEDVKKKYERFKDGNVYYCFGSVLPNDDNVPCVPSFQYKNGKFIALTHTKMKEWKDNDRAVLLVPRSS